MTWLQDRPPRVALEDLLTVLIEEVGRWGRYELQVAGVQSHRLPEIRDVRPKSKPKIVTDPGEIARFFNTRGR